MLNVHCKYFRNLKAFGDYKSFLSYPLPETKEELCFQKLFRTSSNSYISPMQSIKITYGESTDLSCLVISIFQAGRFFCEQPKGYNFCVKPQTKKRCIMLVGNTFKFFVLQDLRGLYQISPFIMRLLLPIDVFIPPRAKIDLLLIAWLSHSLAGISKLFWCLL